MEDKSLRARLNETFNRYNYVGIKNPLKEEFKWPVALEQNEILNAMPGESPTNEDMARKGGGSFLPSDGITREKTRLIEYVIAPGERKMVPGESAYVLVPRLVSKYIRAKYGSGKAGLSKMQVPFYQDEALKEILVGPIVNNVAQVINEFASQLDSKIEDGFSSVEAKEPVKNAKKTQPAK